MVPLLVLGLFFLHRAGAQGTIGLPACAQTCSVIAANVAGCDVNDTSCLCAGSSFISESIQCSRNFCSRDDQSTLTEYLQSMCGLLTTTTDPTSGPPGTSTGTFTGSITLNTTVSTTTSSGTSSTSATSSAPATVIITVPPPTASTGTGTSSISSVTNRTTTTVVIQTVPPTSISTSGNISRLVYDQSSIAFATALMVLRLAKLW